MRMVKVTADSFKVINEIYTIRSLFLNSDSYKQDLDP